MDKQTVKSVKFNDDLEPQKSDSESEDLSRQFNKFQLLNLIDDQKASSNEDSSKHSSECDYDGVDETVIGDCTPKNSGTTSSRSKNRRRRKKGKRAQKHDDVVDIDVQLNYDSTTHKESKENELFKSRELHFHLLKLDSRHLIPENELKRMFGKSVLKEERARDSKGRYHFSSGQVRSRFVSSGFHDNKNAHLTSGPKMELDEIFCRSNVTSTTTATTDTTRGSKSSNNSNLDVRHPVYFKFVHEKAYQISHNIFLDAAQRGYSEGVIQNLNMFPSHVESLIQLSDMIRITEDYKAASELIERALLIFERGFHQQFHFTSGNCRLSYRRPENRSFFITIFKHINYIDRRGLRRTPLEYTKFLLSLDPENDPLFATLLLDFYAIRSEEYDYLIEFITNWKHLSRLPNLNFSLALAYYMKSRSLKKGKAVGETSSKLADECLQNALMRYPNFIIPLLDACSAEPSSELQNCDYFNYTVYNNNYKLVPESVNLLIALYVERNLILWKTKEVLTWLEKNIAILVGKFATKELTNSGLQLEYWSSFQGPLPRNLLRHIVLSELKVKVPSSATSSSILDIDPYPPSESIVSYTREESSSSTGGQNADAYHLGFPTLFIRSFLPSFSLGEPDRNQSDR